MWTDREVLLNALPEAHASLVRYAASVMRARFPGKEEHEYRRAESVLKTAVRSRVRGSKRIWTLSVPDLGLNLERTETI